MTLDLRPDGLANVPSVKALASRGLARQRTADSAWTIDDAGYDEMREAMAHNATILRGDTELRRRLEAAASRPRARA